MTISPPVNSPSVAEKRALLARLMREKAKKTKQTYPLAYNQLAFWYLYQTDPQSAAYNIGVPVRVCTPVDSENLKDAFQQLLNRHPALRTTIQVQNGEPVAEVCGYQDISFEVVDASGWDESLLMSELTAVYKRPFDLAQGPLFRVHLFTQTPDNHLLLLTIHHIVCDAHSIWVLLEELQKLYVAKEMGHANPLPPLTETYANFVQWQNNMLAGAQGKALKQYWQQQLTAPLPTLNLPTDFPRPPIVSFNGDSYRIKLSSELTQQLRQLAQSNGVTLYMLCLATYQLFLYRLTGQEDIVVGSPMAGRTQRQFARLVGNCINSVILRANLSGNPTFQTFLQQVRQTVLGGIQHQSYPLPLLASQLQSDHDPSRSSLFQAEFSLRKPPPFAREENIASVGLQLQSFDMAEEEGQFELSLQVVDSGTHLHLVFKYNTDLFAQTTMQRWGSHLQMLFHSVVDDSQQCIANLPLLSEAEQKQILVQWNETQVNYPSNKSLPALFADTVAQFPQKTAVRMGQVAINYQALNERANRLAHFLKAAGITPDTMVGICIERSIDLVVAILGVLKAGGAYIPLDPSFPPKRMSYILEDARASLLLTQQKYSDLLPDTTKKICLDQDWAQIAHENNNNPTDYPQPQNLAYVIYTSGSTGTPKGTLVHQQGVVNYLSWCNRTYNIADAGGSPIISSIGFDLVLTSFYPALFSGAGLTLLPEGKEIESLVTTLQAGHDFSLIKITPGHLDILNQMLPPQPRDRYTRAILIGGEALSGENLTAWQMYAPQTQLTNHYGPTETVIGCCTYKIPKRIMGNVPIGRPIDNTQLYIVDKQMQPVPVGIAGELLVGGDGVTRGYLNRPSLTAEKFIPDPFSKKLGARLYKTGDLVRYLPDGNIEFLGRFDHQLKVRGYRIELGEVENAIRQHPNCANCVVIARENKSGFKELIAYVVPQTGDFDLKALRTFLADYLPSYMIPTFFIPLKAFPLTANGKLDRRALPEVDLSSRQKQFIAPRDALELKLVPIWEEVLDIRPISVNDNFFELGGNSLLAVRLMAKIQHQFDQNLPLAILLQGGTIGQLADWMRQETTPDWSPLVPIQPHGEKRPFFCIPGAGGNVIYLHNLARHLGTEQPFYGLQAKGLDAATTPHQTVEEMAAYYLEAIQSVQPNGPYLLGGHSLGGWVAFEIAQQLLRQGETVNLVAIIDTTVPELANHTTDPNWNDARWIVELAHRIRHLLNPDLEISYDHLQSLTAAEQLLYFKEQLIATNLFPAEAGIDQLQSVLRLFKAHAQVRYTIGQDAFSTPIVLFRAQASEEAEYPPNFPRETWGWDAYGSVEAYRVPGEHLTLLTEPYVKTLANQLRDCLDRAGSVETISTNNPKQEQEDDTTVKNIL